MTLQPRPRARTSDPALIYAGLPPSNIALVESLQSMSLFEALSVDQLGWLVGHSEESSFDGGERIFTEEEPANALWVLIEGEWRLSRLVGGHETVLVTTDQSGSWAGAIPVVSEYFPLTARVTRPSRLLRIPSDVVQQMLTTGFPIAPHLLAGISTGTRNFEALVRQQEKLAALGKLSAGLSHELNNPASAARRAASQLRVAIHEQQSALIDLIAEPEGERLCAGLKHLEEAIGTAIRSAQPLSPLARSDREDAVTAWLDEREVPDAWDAASTLVEAGIDTSWLAGVARDIPARSLPAALRWVVAMATTNLLLATLEHGTTRISELVASVKAYSYMDQGQLQEVDIHCGLENTLTILGHKLRNGITVERDYAPDLPRILARGGDLNQVWTNLLDNSADALGNRGRIRISTRRDGEKILVEINDDGPGIPADAQPRIWEPFYTTKPVGEGTGLGLDIARRIVVTTHGGDLSVESQPGNTTFRITLPLKPPS